MKAKNIVINIDHENGIIYMPLLNKEVKRTISLSNKGCQYLNDEGADIVLDFDENDKLIGLELIGFN
jgi:hypothetical protein